MFLKATSIVGQLIVVYFAYLGWRDYRRRTSLLQGIGFNPNERRTKQFAIGMAIGTTVMLGIFVSLRQLGYLHTGFAPIQPRTYLWLAAVPLVALWEEFLSRGLILHGLETVLNNKWLAVIASAALFGVLHAMNPGATPRSVLSNAMGGVIYGTAFVLTRNLWLGWGVHTAWNLVQGPVLGFIVSGFNLGGLLHTTVQGPAALTGGSYGPEGGWVAIAWRVVALLLVIVVAQGDVPETVQVARS